MTSAIPPFAGIPVGILCGGRGLILEGSHGERINKALVPIAGRPMVWWVMLHYALHGGTDFVLAAGLQHERLAATLAALPGAAQHPADAGCLNIELAGRSCQVRVVPTPAQASTGERIVACQGWLSRGARFALTYSDTLCDVDLGAQLRQHTGTGGTATLLAAQYPLRFRILGMRQDEHLVRRFSARPVIESAPVNGGYYLFEPSIWSPRYLGAAEAGLVLEERVLERLAHDVQLSAFAHRGHWQHLDCERDLAGLEAVAARLAHSAQG